MHRIRLGPPWDTTTADGRTRHARKFGRPRTLSAGETVWLVCDSLPDPADVSVNGEPVGSVGEAGGPFAADITARLNSRNEVVIDTPSAGQLGEVTLEIRGGPDPPS